jgi:cytochrome c-type biogenesis protein CcmH
LAIDLRNEIYNMMKAGKSKQDVVKFMVERYGDFVLYSPPLKPSTYPIWIGPLIIILIATFVVFRILKRISQSRENDLSKEERERLERLLSQSTETGKTRDTHQ